jgi:hypothetical protein
MGGGCGMSAQAAICNTKYFAGKANELQLLRDRVEELEELLGMGPSVNAKIVALGFTRAEASVLGLLLKREGCVSRDFLWTALYGSRAEGDQPHDRLVDVWIMKCRRKLKRFKVEIVTVWGSGWLISKDDKSRLREQIEAAL